MHCKLSRLDSSSHRPCTSLATHHQRAQRVLEAPPVQVRHGLGRRHAQVGEVQLGGHHKRAAGALQVVLPRKGSSCKSMRVKRFCAGGMGRSQRLRASRAASSIFLFPCGACCAIRPTLSTRQSSGGSPEASTALPKGVGWKVREASSLREHQNETEWEANCKRQGRRNEFTQSSHAADGGGKQVFACRARMQVLGQLAANAWLQPGTRASHQKMNGCSLAPSQRSAAIVVSATFCEGRARACH